ncbi:MAG: glycosyltransferase family 2 protein [Pseudohongiellaceae bacterium]
MTEKEQAPHRPLCCAVIVTWEPPVTVLLALVEQLLADDCPCRIIDNGSSNAASMLAAFDHLPAGDFSVSWLPANLGLAAALNRGLEQTVEEGFRYALLFDQDSCIDSCFSRSMLDAFREASALIPRPLAALGPRVQNPDSGRRTPFRVFDRWLFRSDRRIAGERPFFEAGFLVTSGTLLDLGCLSDIGLMREEYFIDNIDVEWCFRARARGYAVVGTDRAVLHHRIGEASDRWLVRRGWVVEHSPLRCYYSTRNRLHLQRQPYAPAGWVWRDRIRFLLKSAWLLLCTEQRRAYWRNLQRGIRDAGELT